MLLGSCRKGPAKGDAPATITTVDVVKVARKSLRRQISLSSELVPFQVIDVYAKESGYVQKLYVDYGTRVKQGQLMAILEIPELEAQLQEDQAAIKSASDEVARAQHMLKRYQAESKVLHLEYTRLHGVFATQPGLVAQQEVDDAEGKDLAGAAQVDAAQAALAAAQSNLLATQSKLAHDQALFAYSRITAPFSGVVTQRYANLGTLMQSGTNSSTQAMPLVTLSEDDLFRLVIPVPESSAPYVRLGDDVDVRVSSLGRTFPGKVGRFSVNVREDTRTMHTEVDVPNPDRILMPGLYAEAVLTLEKRDNVLALPLRTVSYQASEASVYVVDDASEVEHRTVSLGMTTVNEVEIESGLREGERVVVSDRSTFRVGQRVAPRVVVTLGEQEQTQE